MQFDRYAPSSEMKALLAKAILACENKTNTTLSAHFSLAGDEYDGELMVIGRFLNGGINNAAWYGGAEMPETTAKLLAEIYGAAPTKCPLRWVVDNDNPGYNVNRSAFWRVSRDLLMGLTSSDHSNWSSRLAWGNLYKIGPYDTGNPSDRLCYAQVEECDRILQLEIEALRPRNIVFICGENWLKGFKLPLRPTLSSANRALVASGGVLTCGDHKAKYVVADRPEGKTEKDWAGEVLKALNGIRLS